MTTNRAEQFFPCRAIALLPDIVDVRIAYVPIYQSGTFRHVTWSPCGQNTLESLGWTNVHDEKQQRSSVLFDQSDSHVMRYTPVRAKQHVTSQILDEFREYKTDNEFNSIPLGPRDDVHGIFVLEKTNGFGPTPPEANIMYRDPVTKERKSYSLTLKLPEGWQDIFVWARIAIEPMRIVYQYKEAKDVDPIRGLPHMEHTGTDAYFHRVYMHQKTFLRDDMYQDWRTLNYTSRDTAWFNTNNVPDTQEAIEAQVT